MKMIDVKYLKHLYFFIHKADHSPCLQWSLVSHRFFVCPSAPTFLNKAKITAGRDCGIAEWFTDLVEFKIIHILKLFILTDAPKLNTSNKPE